MRVLWLLPKAAPALLRHIGAYVELVALELEQSRRDLTVNMLASVIAGVCVFFAVLMGCVVIVALTWDTPYRVPAVAWTGGAFLTAAVLALIYRSKVMKDQQPFLDSVKREWQEDVVVLENILAEPEQPRAQS
jgi:uncharacterized membrane protein YqjE